MIYSAILRGKNKIFLLSDTAVTIKYCKESDQAT